MKTGTKTRQTPIVVQDGWGRHGIQPSRERRALLGAEADRRGHGSIKTIGTAAAICLFLGLPKEKATRFFEVTQRCWKGSGPIEPRADCRPVVRGGRAMTTIRVTTNRYASLCQSILTLANDANVAALDSKPSCSTSGDRAIEIDADTLHHLHRRAVAIAKAIESIADADQPDSDRLSPTTPCRYPLPALSSAGVDQTPANHLCTGEGTRRCGARVRPSVLLGQARCARLVARQRPRGVSNQNPTRTAPRAG